MGYGPLRRGRPTFKELQRELAQQALAEDQTVADAKLADPSVHQIVKQGILNRRAWAQATAAQAPPKRHKVRRPVDGKPPHASEHQEQSAVISWWRHKYQSYGLPEFALFAIPNGGARDAITGSRLKDEGVRRGALDLMLAKSSAKYHGLFVEMKVGSNKPTEEQTAFIAYLRDAGYRCAVCWSAAAATAEIEGYLADDNYGI